MHYWDKHKENQSVQGKERKRKEERTSKGGKKTKIKNQPLIIAEMHVICSIGNI